MTYNQGGNKFAPGYGGKRDMLEGLKIFLGRDPLLSIFILGVSIIAIGVVALEISNDLRELKNPCVISDPRIVVSSDILYPDRLFSIGPTRYSLDFSGTRRLTGVPCLISMDVTENEYERHRYKD